MQSTNPGHHSRVHSSDAEKIILVQGNLNTLTPASLYEGFPPAEAKRLADKLELDDARIKLDHLYPVLHD